MAPFVVNADHVHAFKDRAALERWYKKHHLGEDEFWLKVFKVGSGVASVTIADALDVALCHGWIDAIRKSLDAESYLQRYTPRNRTSIWSKKNITNVERLIEEGRMTSYGQAEIDKAKADGRWDRAYASGAKLETPPELLAAIKANPSAQKLYESLSAQNRFALAFRVHHLKTEAGRKKRIESFVAMLARGETIYPNGKRQTK
ncbi:MAG: YdeI/OmpD-associated family protein [Devosia sp.]